MSTPQGDITKQTWMVSDPQNGVWEILVGLFSKKKGGQPPLSLTQHLNQSHFPSIFAHFWVICTHQRSQLVTTTGQASKLIDEAVVCPPLASAQAGPSTTNTLPEGGQRSGHRFSRKEPHSPLDGPSRTQAIFCRCVQMRMSTILRKSFTSHPHLAKQKQNSCKPRNARYETSRFQLIILMSCVKYPKWQIHIHV